MSSFACWTRRPSTPPSSPTRAAPGRCRARCGCLPASDVVHALLHAGHRRLRDAIDGLRMAAIDEATWVALDPARRSVFDVDEPEDLNR